MKKSAYAYYELGKVCLDLTATKREKRNYPNPLFMPVEMTPGQARHLARRLIRAAADIDRWDAEVEAYFRGFRKG